MRPRRVTFTPRGSPSRSLKLEIAFLDLVIDGFLTGDGLNVVEGIFDGLLAVGLFADGAVDHDFFDLGNLVHVGNPKLGFEVRSDFLLIKLF